MIISPDGPYSNRTMMAYVEVARIQEKCVARGWRWEEIIMENGQVIVNIVQSDNPTAFLEREDHLGWGRFDRWWAWHMLEVFIDRWDSYEEYVNAGRPHENDW